MSIDLVPHVLRTQSLKFRPSVETVKSCTKHKNRVICQTNKSITISPIDAPHTASAVRRTVTTFTEFTEPSMSKLMAWVSTGFRHNAYYTAYRRHSCKAQFYEHKPSYRRWQRKIKSSSFRRRHWKNRSIKTLNVLKRSGTAKILNTDSLRTDVVLGILSRHLKPKDRHWM